MLGKFPYPPYFWWLSGAAWGAMVEYTNYTGDDSYAHVTYDALVSQISPTGNYLPEAEMYDEVCTHWPLFKLYVFTFYGALPLFSSLLPGPWAIKNLD